MRYRTTYTTTSHYLVKRSLGPNRRDPLVTATLWLDACPRMAVATGIAQTYARHLLTTMAARRTLDEAFPGRFLDKFLAPEHTVVLDTNPDRARKIARANMARYLQLPHC